MPPASRPQPPAVPAVQESSAAAAPQEAQQARHLLRMLAEIALSRPARQQVAAGPAAQDNSAAAASGEYNIWYHKKPGREHRSAPATTRVNLAKDAGRTLGNNNPAAFICMPFTKGNCSGGPHCRFLHRPPLQEDLERLDISHDIFGRERHATHRTDMSGVGSWSKEQRTLYIGRLAASTTDRQVRGAFEEFGALESCRVFASRGFAFVTYQHRGITEFAYAAMMDQSLGESPQINVRWAEEDPNPTAKRRRTKANDARVGAAVAASVHAESDGAAGGMDAGLEARLEALRGGGPAAVSGGGGGSGGGAWRGGVMGAASAARSNTALSSRDCPYCGEHCGGHCGGGVNGGGVSGVDQWANLHGHAAAPTVDVASQVAAEQQARAKAAADSRQRLQAALAGSIAAALAPGERGRPKPPLAASKGALTGLSAYASSSESDD
jgi:hypothetical protein